jgi:hypothetical protein
MSKRSRRSKRIRNRKNLPFKGAPGGPHAALEDNGRPNVLGREIIGGTSASPTHAPDPQTRRCGEPVGTTPRQRWRKEFLSAAVLALVFAVLVDLPKRRPTADVPDSLSTGASGSGSSTQRARERSAAELQERLRAVGDPEEMRRIIGEVYRRSSVEGWIGRLARYPKRTSRHNQWELTFDEVGTPARYRVLTGDDASSYRPGDCFTLVVAQIIDIDDDLIAEIGDGDDGTAVRLVPCSTGD